MGEYIKLFEEISIDVPLNIFISVKKFAKCFPKNYKKEILDILDKIENNKDKDEYDNDEDLIMDRITNLITPLGYIIMDVTSIEKNGEMKHYLKVSKRSKRNKY